MQNSSKYRKPPLKRTRDSFIDDANLQTNRADFSQNRHLEVRRDKDRTRSLGITLYDVDFAINFSSNYNKFHYCLVCLPFQNMLSQKQNH